MKTTMKIALLILLFVVLLYPQGYFVLDKTQYSINEPRHPNGTISYIINLDRAKGRYNYVEPQIKLLGYDVVRISAVDGAMLSENEIHQKTNFEAYKTYLGHYPKRGMIGCNLSHFKAWEAFLRSNAQFALIFEDDISFDHKTLRGTVELLKGNQNLWDVVTFEISHRGTPLTLKHFNETKNNLSIYLTEVSHAGAYLINREAAKKLLQKSLPIKMPIDHYFTRSWEFGLKFTGIEPRIVHQTYGDSNINNTKRYSPDNHNQTLLASLQRGVFKLQSYLIRFFYNLKIYIQLL